jgi:hypothetical protein
MRISPSLILYNWATDWMIGDSMVHVFGVEFMGMAVDDGKKRGNKTQR